MYCSVLCSLIRIMDLLGQFIILTHLFVYRTERYTVGKSVAVRGKIESTTFYEPDGNTPLKRGPFVANIEMKDFQIAEPGTFSTTCDTIAPVYSQINGGYYLLRKICSKLDLRILYIHFLFLFIIKFNL